MSKNIEQVFKHITHGVYVISVIDGEQRNAFTAAWVMQVSFDPPLVCFSINPEHHSYKLLQQGRVCCINVLDDEQYVTADHFGKSDIKDKMAGYSWLETKSKAPALADSLAFFDCRVDHFSDAGDHKLVICKVIDATILNEGNPMLYNDTDDMDESSELYK
jgi:flavin reductase (DIM6/NTAB) family NADH-FMN oxidoreductase RutF